MVLLQRKPVNCMSEKVCPVARKCSGCQLSNLSYEQQLDWKMKDLNRLLGEYGEVSRIIPMEDPTGYRCKVQAVFRSDRNGNIISGVYQSSRNGIVSIDRCMINDPRADEIIVGIRGLMRSFRIRPWDPGTDRGFVKHVLVRIGRNTGEILVNIVGAVPMFPKKRDFTAALVKKFPAIKTVTYSVNRSPEFLTLGDHAETLYGDGYIIDEICGKRFRISPQSFYQVNPVQTEILYGKALEYAGLTGKETVVDAYCGTGTIGMIASDKAGKVIGVELNADAVRDARNNAKANQIRNIQFYQNDAGKFLVEMAGQGAKVDVVMMDPPRSGSTEEFMSSVVQIGPERIVYVSCNPETLVRDLKYFKKKGYRVAKGVGVDMFPFTDSLEAVTLLVRQKK